MRLCFTHPYCLLTVSLLSPNCPSPLSDRVPEGELSRPVVLQPGGAAHSALLQPGPHTPQSEKQLHVPAQRCSSSYQVTFCTHFRHMSIQRVLEQGHEQEEPTDEALYFPLYYLLYFGCGTSPLVVFTVLGSYHMV